MADLVELCCRCCLVAMRLLSEDDDRNFPPKQRKSSEQGEGYALSSVSGDAGAPLYLLDP
jgi:hypothetical protein